MAFVTRRWVQVTEALIITFVNTTIMFFAAMYLGTCHKTLSKDDDYSDHPQYRSYFCPQNPGEGSYVGARNSRLCCLRT